MRIATPLFPLSATPPPLRTPATERSRARTCNSSPRRIVLAPFPPCAQELPSRWSAELRLTLQHSTPAHAPVAVAAARRRSLLSLVILMRSFDRASRALSLCLAALCVCGFVSSVRAAEPFRTDNHPEPAEPASGWYWGSVDANVDWCERNYATTQYCAEFYNALSSLPIAGFALFGLIMGRRHARADTRISFAFSLMVLVGLGSFMFHATLRRYAQAMDELPMLYGSIALLYNAIDHNVSAEDRAAIANGEAPQPFWAQVRYRFALKFTLVSCAVILTSIYFYFPQLSVPSQPCSTCACVAQLPSSSLVCVCVCVVSHSVV